jgi:hypothetical protein
MKPKKAVNPKAAKATAPEWRWQPYAWAAAAIVLVFWAYGPALNGAFVFDDTVLPYARLGQSGSSGADVQLLGEQADCA